MTLYRIGGWLRAMLRRDLVEREMQDEMQLHLDRAVERLVARGLSPEAARREARREFGNVAYIQEEARDARGVRAIEDAVQDVRYAVRGLRRMPGFAFAVIATLGLGVGANATMFGVVDRLLFRPPAYLVAPERAHHLYLARIVNGRELIGQAAQYQRVRDLVASSATTEVLAAYAPRRLAVGADDSADEMTIGAASASFWQLFDARPALGRFFTAAEDRDVDGTRVVVLSHAYWQSRYGGSPNVLGTTIVIRPTRYTVIGVAPRGFGGVTAESPDAYIPIAVAAADDFGPAWGDERTQYNMTWLEIYGRRSPGVALDAATADLSAAYRESYRKQIALDPDTPPIEIAKPRIVLGSVLAERGPSPSAASKVMRWLLGATCVVLLIACANVGNLLLARAVRRRREIAIRIALGVSRTRLTGQLLIESGVLAVCGMVAGLMLAHLGGAAVHAFLAPSAEWQSAFTDRRVLLFSGVCAAVAALLAGVAPVLQASRSDVTTTLKAGARDGDARSRLRAALVLAQAVLSVVLLVGAGLFVRSVDRAARVHLGYDADRLLLVQLRLRSAVLDSAQQVALRHTLLERAAANPLVESATLMISAPFSGTRTGRVFVAGVDSTGRLGEFLEQTASPAYFRTTGTRIRRGRGIGPNDGSAAPLVAVVSDAMARALWPGQDAIGQCIRRRSDTAPCRTVVGIAEDVKMAAIGDDPTFMYYLPAAQVGEHEGRLFVRVRGDAAAHSDAIRRDLQSVMPPSGYLAVRPMTRSVASVTRSWRLGAAMFAVFGALALTLTAIGLYGVIAYTVAQRTREVGLRIALGARVADVVALVAGDALRVVVTGVAIGLTLALAVGRWIGPLLFQVSPRDPVVLGAVTIVLLCVALVASALPAMRASRVDPATALRAD